jgi:hypothetical protein
MNRKTAIQALIALTFSALSGIALSAESDPVKIGVLADMSGVYADIGREDGDRGFRRRRARQTN